MKIGVDGFSLRGNLTGIGRYSYEILKRILSSEHEWYIYVSEPIDNIEFLSSNVNVRVLPKIPFFPRILSLHLFLNRQAKIDEIDYFWSPTHRLPFRLDNKIGTVVTIHDLVWHKFPLTMKPVNRFLDRISVPYAVGKAKKIICVSNSTAQDLSEKFSGLNHKIEVIYLASFIDDVPTVKNFSYGKGYILFVGTLEPRKNLINLIYAYSMLDQSLRDKHKLYIVGGRGWGQLNIEAIIEENNLGEDVKIFGYVDDSVLKSMYLNAIFLAMPSLYEGFGLPLVEAMSQGLPIMTSNLSSMPEIASDSAVYIDKPENLNSIYNKLNELLINEKLRKQLSINSYNNAKNFNWENSAIKTLNFIMK